MARDELEKKDPEAENVCLLGRLAGGEVFGGDVTDRPSHCGGDVRVMVIEQLRQPKVSHNALAIVVQQYVRSLDVPMNDLRVALLVQVQ